MIVYIQRTVLAHKAIVKKYALAANYTLCLSGKLYAGFAGKAHFSGPFVQLVDTDTVRHLAEVIVAGVFHRVRKGLVGVLTYL